MKLARPVLKLGGSVLTDKCAQSPRLRVATVKRIATMLSSLPREIRPLALVHGAGSFGHLIVSRTQIHKRITGARSLAAWAETQILVNELNARICRILVDAGLPCMPFQPSSVAVTRKGELVRLDPEPLTLCVAQGLVPVLYGVPVADREGGCRILSGDALAPFLASVLHTGWVLHGTDVNGVYQRDPKIHPSASPIRLIDRKNWERILPGLAGSRSVDVTGGMAAKVSSLVAWAKKGIRSRIVDARKPELLKRALRGEVVGTEIRW